MMDSKLADEAARLAALRRYEVLDTPPEAPFDKITNLVRTVLNVPISAVSLIDTDRQWFKSCIGLDATQTARDISFCTHTIKAREPMIIPDASADPRFAANPLVTGAPFIASYAGVPLESPDGYNLGSLCAIDTIPRQFDPKQIDVLRSFGAIVVDELEMRRIAQIDHLTGAISRRGFFAEADKAISRLARHNHPSCIVMFDVDHFKRVNDTYGHPGGDLVLKAIGQCFSHLARPTDAFGRLGGEEFAILLADMSLAEAAIAAERFRATLENLVIEHNPPIRITASFGIAALTAKTCSADDWLAEADHALYRAKRTGRNKICVAGDNVEALAS